MLIVECVNSVVWVVFCVFVIVAGLLILYSSSWLFAVILVCSWWLLWCGFLVDFCLLAVVWIGV